MIKPSDTRLVRYYAPKSRYATTATQSISPLGIDTEADVDGRVFMICLSDGKVIKPPEWPYVMFSRKYRSQTYVAYNLKYDSGALLQHLPADNLNELRASGRTTHNDYKYHVIANKYLSIAKNKKYITIYDIMQFYGGSLDANAARYLDEHKIDIETKRFEEPYITIYWDQIAKYCIHDADLTARLAQRFIAQLNSWDMHVTKLYSTAWISYNWFASRCGHPTVKQFWLKDRKVLDFAMNSYNGGKFELTKKGSGYLYEYDIVSAYSHSISNLVDLYHCGVTWSNRYVNDAVYAFIDCTVNIDPSLPSPIAIKRGLLNTYPAGSYRKVITKQEYDYLISNNTDITIHEACWIIPNRLDYLYRDEVRRVVEIKRQYKHGDQLAYHTAKLILNSLYGKFVQLIEQTDGKWRAGSSWNPIYGAVITAETRVRISDLQRQYPSIWAVHTDSVISDKPLPFGDSKQLGDLSYEVEGYGAIIGCGIYQIGDTTAIRGVQSKQPLLELAQFDSQHASIDQNRPISWRQTMHRNLPVDHINRWIESNKNLRVDMDRKRIWIDDYTRWSELTERTVESMPFMYNTAIYPDGQYLP